MRTADDGGSVDMAVDDAGYSDISGEAIDFTGPLRRDVDTNLASASIISEYLRTEKLYPAQDPRSIPETNSSYSCKPFGNRGPVLVFTESRREATEYSIAFAKDRPRASEGISFSELLDLFSEPTESSQQLRENAERRAALHTADLSPQERQVIEDGFLKSKFDVCFATSTLAAGVNFPFRSIVFPKLTFQWGTRAGTNLTLADYRNMSGRAGRLGMHENGYAVLLPRTMAELNYAKRLVAPTNEMLSSQLVDLSLRKTILILAHAVRVTLRGNRAIPDYNFRQ